MKKVSIVVGIVLFIIVEIFILTTITYKNNTIPDNYKIIFKGESGEVVYTTYYYEKKKVTLNP